MKHLLRIFLLFCTLFIVYGSLEAQLPPTIHRISEFDTAMDLPNFPRGGREILVAPGEKPQKPKEIVPIREFSQQELNEICTEFQLEGVRAENYRPGVLEHWGEQYCELALNLQGKNERGDSVPPRGAAEQVYDSEALVFPNETHPLDVLLRRTDALLKQLEENASKNQNALQTLRRDWQKCVNASKNADIQQRDRLFFAAAAIRRETMFLNPALDSVSRILFCARASYAGSRLTGWFNSDRIGGHFSTQVYGFNTIHGGGIFTISDWRNAHPTVSDVLADRVVSPLSREKRLVGKSLNYGSFMAPELSFDGRTLYFSHCGAQEHAWKWTPDTTWNLFSLDLDGHDLRQLTDGPYNDFDVCELPSGRLAFISERRGGFIRCFAESAGLRVTTAVLHGMKKDGSDIYPLSFFETSEWQPSVDNRGMIVYTRWDYTDRENCLGSQFWTCFPDGRNPRAPHGNYPQPWHTFSENSFDDTRRGASQTAPSGLPMTEMQIRAIPGSHKYILLAAPHHGETFGSICVLDLREKNDFHMNQLRRVTPFQPFPESECAGRSQYRYGAPWPLDENVFLCNSWEDLVLLDRFGNEELICERELLPIGYDPRLRLSDPIPVRPRPVPPEIAQQTAQGEDFDALSPNEKRSVIGVVNVHISDQPFPADRPLRYLRVFQVIPKPNPWMNTPNIGFAPENTPRVPLGFVPLEADGSALFEAPSGKQLIFQVLDADFKAVQTMRAVTFTHPGETLVCTGCHEPMDESVKQNQTLPLAFQKPAKKLENECDFTEPINFYRLIQPVTERSCIPCHAEKNLKFQRMEHEDFRPYVFYFAGGMSGAVMEPIHGGSRSIPGRCGAGASRLSEILTDENHRESVSESDRHRFYLWLDANAPRLGAFRDEEAQKRGELVTPILDFD